MVTTNEKGRTTVKSKKKRFFSYFFSSHNWRTFSQMMHEIVFQTTGISFRFFFARQRFFIGDLTVRASE